MLIALTLLAQSVSSAHEMPKILGVREAVERHHELDGQTIRVSGYVPYCKLLDCAIHAKRNSHSKPYLRLGSSEAFDAQVQSWLGKRIVVEGRLEAKCIHLRADPPAPLSSDDELIVCFDRANELRDPKIVSDR